MKLFLTVDTGHSGHGTVGREYLNHLLKQKQIKINCSTHFWGWNTKGWKLGTPSRQFPDKRMQEKLIREKRVNPDYLLYSLREAKNRPHELDSLPFYNQQAGRHELIVKDYSINEREDINHAIGSTSFAVKQPTYAYNITETTVNTTHVPTKWREFEKITDEIWVPTIWSKQAFINTRGFNEDKIKVVPYGVDFHKPTFCDSITKLEDETFTFGTVGRWANLKAMDILIKAYINEFIPSKDNVRLFIKTTVNYQKPLNAQMISQAVRQLIIDEHIYDPPEIGFMSDPLSLQAYWDMLNTFNCFVLPTRAESIGISLVQAMGIGKPTIATKYSAITDYLDTTTGFPVQCEEVPIQQHSPLLYFYGEEHKGNWADPDQQHLQEQMRKVYNMHQDNPEKLKKIAENGKKKVRKIYDWNKHIQTRIKRYEEIIK